MGWRCLACGTEELSLTNGGKGCALPFVLLIVSESRWWLVSNQVCKMNWAMLLRGGPSATVGYSISVPSHPLLTLHLYQSSILQISALWHSYCVFQEKMRNGLVCKDMGPGKASTTTYSKWCSLGMQVCGRATCWTASPTRSST